LAEFVLFSKYLFETVIDGHFLKVWSCHWYLYFL